MNDTVKLVCQKNPPNYSTLWKEFSRRIACFPACKDSAITANIFITFSVEI